MPPAEVGRCRRQQRGEREGARPPARWARAGQTVRGRRWRRQGRPPNPHPPGRHQCYSGKLHTPSPKQAAARPVVVLRQCDVGPTAPVPSCQPLRRLVLCKPIGEGQLGEQCWGTLKAACMRCGVFSAAYTCPACLHWWQMNSAVPTACIRRAPEQSPDWYAAPTPQHQQLPAGPSAEQPRRPLPAAAPTARAWPSRHCSSCMPPVSGRPATLSQPAAGRSD